MPLEIPNINLSLSHGVAQNDEIITGVVTNTTSASHYNWNWGDSTFTLSGTNEEEHIWTGVTVPTTYTISVTAFNETGTGTDTAQIQIWQKITETTATQCSTTADYISLCGKAIERFGSCRQIDLTSFLPEHLRAHDALQFTEFFQNFLNTLYVGVCGVEISTENYTEASGTSGEAVSADINIKEFTYTEPTIENNNNSCSLCSAWDANNTISILEKIFRLTETHDPELIDIEFIQFFASNMGYDVDINRQEIGTNGTSSSGDCVEVNTEKYLRFMVENLPHWYKIKTTQNAIKIMLFSFGLVGDIINYYTEDYERLWKSSQPEFFTSGSSVPFMREKLSEIDDSWYPTPHFAVWFDIKRSATNFSFNVDKQSAIIKAIDSVRPINTVFEGVQAYFSEIVNTYARSITRVRRYISVPAGDNSSDWYGWVNPY